MPRDNRERNFENALARNLQDKGLARPSADVHANVSSPVPAAHSVVASDCPDTEILAAYHERLLAPEEMISRKAHVSSCLRCQEILAQLEVTDEIPLEADQRELQPNSPVAVPQMQLVHAARASASPTVREAVAKSDFQPDVPPRPADRRWLILSGALVAVLLVWVAVHESTPQPFQITKNQQQPVSGLPAAAPAPPADSTKDKSAGKELQLPLAANGPVAKKDALALDRQAMQEEKALPPSPAARPAPRGDFRAGVSGASAARVGAASRVVAPSPSQGKQPTRDATMPAPASATPTPGDSVTDSANETTVTVTGSAPQDAMKAADGGVVAAPRLTQSQTARAGAPAFREASNLATKLVQVSPPDGTVIWRLGPSGFLQRSEDSGSHWTLQKSATIVDLLAGSAPSSKVCWIAGRNGTVLRTMDGGQHWQKVPSPTAEDVTTVFALDVQQATITTPTQSYKTIDGGSTWTPLAP
jgi:hypothetical protein